MVNIKTKKVKAIYYKSLICPDCGNELTYHSELLSFPPQYSYCCDICGKVEITSLKPGYEVEFEDEEI